MCQEFNRMENILSDLQLKNLRDKGVINESEVAYQSGDLIVAEDVVTKNRRIINTKLEELVEESSSSRRLLKG